MNKSETLQSLYFYRTNLNQKLNEPGWTIWALKGSLVTLIWILTSLIYSETIIIHLSLKIGLILYFIYPLISFVFINKKNKGIAKISEPTYYFLKTELTSLRFQFFFEVSTFLAIYYLVNYQEYLTND